MVVNTIAGGKENYHRNQISYGYYLEQVRTLNKMKLNLHEVHRKVQPHLKERMLKSLRHMEAVVLNYEKLFFKTQLTPKVA